MFDFEIAEDAKPARQALAEPNTSGRGVIDGPAMA